MGEGALHGAVGAAGAAMGYERPRDDRRRREDAKKLDAEIAYEFLRPRLLDQCEDLPAEEMEHFFQNESADHARRSVTRTSRSHSAIGISSRSAVCAASSSSIPGVTPSAPPSLFW